MKKLISMTDFVLEISKKTTNEGNSLVRNFNKIKNYANFLNQPLTLGMFVPCDDEGNIMEEPEFDFKYLRGSDGDDELKIYQKAKEKVIFYGFKFLGSDEENYFIKINDFAWKDLNYCYTLVPKNATIEYLIGVELTENALKQIGL